MSNTSIEQTSAPLTQQLESKENSSLKITDTPTVWAARDIARGTAKTLQASGAQAKALAPLTSARIRGVTLAESELTFDETVPDLQEFKKTLETHKFTKLRLLSVPDLTAQHFELIGQQSHLTGLSLVNCSSCIDKETALLAELRNLAELNLNLSFELTDAGIGYFAQCSQLRCLYLMNCKITDESVKKIAQNFPHLKVLDLGGCRALTDNIGPSLAKLQKLTELSLSGCPNITDDIGSNLAKLKDLTRVDFRGSSNITTLIRKQLSKVPTLFLKHITFEKGTEPEIRLRGF